LENKTLAEMKGTNRKEPWGDITEASDAGRKPGELGKANLLFWQRFKRDRESTARKTTVCLHRMA